jgi:outer membrane murein-binding lipoprotein Lpp
MKKKIVTMMIAGILAASMTACSNNSSEMDSLKRENKELKAQIAELEKKAQQEETSDFSDSDLESKQEEQNKVYGLNETWTVDGLWSLTFTSVTQTEERNQYSDKTPAQVIYLNYGYENIGYQNDLQDLFIGSTSFQIIDSAGEIAETYPLTSTTYPQQIPVGAKCVGAQECIALNNASDNIKIIVSLYDNNYTEHTATFELPVQ